MGAVLYEFDPRNTLDERRAAVAYADTAVAEWAEARAERYGEVVEPTALYINPEDDHTVAWVKHAGLVEPDTDDHVPYTTYHVVCDCAIMAKEAPHPSATNACETVRRINTTRRRASAATSLTRNARGLYLF